MQRNIDSFFGAKAAKSKPAESRADVRPCSPHASCGLALTQLPAPPAVGRGRMLTMPRHPSAGGARSRGPRPRRGRRDPLRRRHRRCRRCWTAPRAPSASTCATRGKGFSMARPRSRTFAGCWTSSSRSANGAVWRHRAAACPRDAGTHAAAADVRRNEVYPPPEHVLSAFKLCERNKVRVVILGQDPYHQPNQVRTPPALPLATAGAAAAHVGCRCRARRTASPSPCSPA